MFLSKPCHDRTWSVIHDILVKNKAATANLFLEIGKENSEISIEYKQEMTAKSCSTVKHE